jgi:hypothetical protein
MDAVTSLKVEPTMPAASPSKFNHDHEWRLP